MIHAYQEIYLNKAQSILGDLFDYAIHVCNFTGHDFVKLFLASSISKRLENGEPLYIAGKSGLEIAVEIIEETTGREIPIETQSSFGRSEAYWIGWVIAYYQWHSGRRYSDIFKVLSFEDLQHMYTTLHEADITKFIDIVDSKMKEYFSETNLKRIRMMYGFTQAELSKHSSVSLRSIQMYEQRNKNINKASVESIYRLAKTLGCTIEDLMERG